ncbi:MAG: Methyltransferase type 12 [Verrucomicrobiales bacterium]|nr:Methyltransferase type 12 [Verrucomicrobiales bacterium]
MNFDRMAPHYRWLEFLFAGGTLQRCRTAWLEKVAHCRSVLITGEGDGRFLEECTKRLPEADILCVDGSPGMLALAQKRTLTTGDGGARDGARIIFQHAILPGWEPPAGQFDLIVTHFFLDCFTSEDLRRVVESLAAAAKPDAIWLLADFRVPDRPPPARVRARMVIATAYAFFRIVTGLKVGRLTDPFPLLEAQGFRLERMSGRSWGMLYSSVWRRRRQAGPANG